MIEETYSIEELNLYLNDLVRHHLGHKDTPQILREMGKKYRKQEGIYKITNTVNGKVYIGSTSADMGFLKRLKNHQLKLINNEHYNIHLQSSYNINGDKAFKYEAIEFFYPDPNLTEKQNKRALEQREQYYMDLYEVRDENKGYNEADHAHGGYNHVTWDTVEARSNITKEQLKSIIDYLVNTELTCQEIDNIAGVRKGLTTKIYNRNSFSKITQDYIFKYRDNQPRGEKSTSSKLKEQDVLEIIEELKRGTSIPEIAKKYKVNKAAIHDIKNKRNWAHLTKDVEFFNYPKVLKDDELSTIYQYSLDGTFQREWKNYREAGRYYGNDASSIKDSLENKSLFRFNHLWSYEKHDKITPKLPIELFFYYYKDNKEHALFEINNGKKCEQFAKISVPIVILDKETNEYMGVWESKTVLVKQIDWATSMWKFRDHCIFQDRYEIIPVREVPKNRLAELKNILEQGVEMDYTVLKYEDKKYKQIK